MKKKITLILDQAIFSGTTFALTIVLSQLLPIEEFGIFAALVVVLYLGLSISHAVIIQPMQIRIATIKEIGVYKAFLVVLLSALLLVFIALMAGIVWMDIELFKPYKSLYLPFLCYGVVFLIQDFFRKYFLSQDQLGATLLIDALAAMGLFALIITTHIFFEVKLGNIFYLLGASVLPSCLVGAWIYRMSSVCFSCPRFFSFLKYHYEEGRWFFLSALSQWWSNNIFVLATGVLINVEALGALRLGQSIFGVFNIILQTIENYFIPTINRSYQASATTGIALLQKLSKQSLLFFAALLIPIVLFSKEIFGWVGGAAYTPYYYVLQGLAILYFIIIIGYPIRIAIRIIELNRIFFLGYLITSILGVFTYNFLLENFGLYGALAGLMMNQIIMLILWQITLTHQKFKLWKSYISY